MNKTTILKYLAHTVFALSLVNVAMSQEVPVENKAPKESPADQMRSLLDALDEPINLDQSISLFSSAFDKSWNLAEQIVANRLKSGVNAVNPIVVRRPYLALRAELLANSHYVFALAKQGIKLSDEQFKTVKENSWNFRHKPGLNAFQQREANILTGLLENMLYLVMPD